MKKLPIVGFITWLSVKPAIVRSVFEEAIAAERWACEGKKELAMMARLDLKTLLDFYKSCTDCHGSFYEGWSVTELERRAVAAAAIQSVRRKEAA